jgi:sulfate permease, SulP family
MGGRLYVSGLEAEMADLLAKTGEVSVTSAVQVFESTPMLGDSTRAALQDAEAWIVEQRAT